MWYSNKCPFCNFCFCLKRSFCNCSCSCGYVTYWYSGKSSRCAPVWIWERAEWELYWASVMFLAWGLPVLGRFLGMTQFWFRFSDDETCSLGGGLYLNWECSLRNFCFAFLENACWCAGAKCIWAWISARCECGLPWVLAKCLAESDGAMALSLVTQNTSWFTDDGVIACIVVVACIFFCSEMANKKQSHWNHLYLFHVLILTTSWGTGKHQNTAL